MLHCITENDVFDQSTNGLVKRKRKPNMSNLRNELYGTLIHNDMFTHE